MIPGTEGDIEQTSVVQLACALDKYGPEHLCVLDERREIAQVCQLADRPAPSAAQKRGPERRGLLVSLGTVDGDGGLEPAEVVRRPHRQGRNARGELGVPFVPL